MFYLKYRPKTLREIDNSTVKSTIETLLNTKNPPHAFLFVGPKGTGKTSVARIIARSIAELKEDESSASSDIIELDAASNRGIDEIRSLIREASYMPMSGKYRVFIIDEAHMITTEGFNALLKTLEEPPSTAVFILATTNIEKVPKTIVSRCIVVNFGKAKKKDILRMLQRISKKESLEIDAGVLNLVCQHSDSSFRDAAKLLEELVVHKKTSHEEAKTYLGMITKEDLLEIVVKSDLKKTLSWINSFVEKGGNVKHLIEHTLEQLREQLMFKSGLGQDNEEDSNTIIMSLGDISSLMKLLQEAYATLKITPIESIPLELAIVDFYNKRKADQLEIKN